MKVGDEESPPHFYERLTFVLRTVPRHLFDEERFHPDKYLRASDALCG